MRRSLTWILLVSGLALFAASGQCFAMMSIAHVSKERAKELGIEIRSQAAGPHAVWVELEFKARGKLKNFSRVDLEIREGEKLLVGYAALREKRSSSGSVVVGFMADRACLDRITLTMVVGAPMNMAGYVLRLKDFPGLEQAGGRPQDDTANKTEQDGADQPAAAVAPKPE